MKVIGLSPLDMDATVTLVEDGVVTYAAAEERFTRVRLQDGFPWQALQDCLAVTGTDLAEVTAVAYPFLAWDEETRLFAESLTGGDALAGGGDEAALEKRLAEAEARVPVRSTAIPGLADPNERAEAPPAAKALALRALAGDSVVSRNVARRGTDPWGRDAQQFHKKWHDELESALADLGLLDRLRRHEHHLTHAANAYFCSGFDEALVVSLDGYGSGLSGTVSLGRGGTLTRLHAVPYPHSLGLLYEAATSGLGLRPGRHEGKVVGLAAYGDPSILGDLLLSRVEREPGSFRLRAGNDLEFARRLAARFPKIDVAAAYQDVVETVATGYIAHHLAATGARQVVLSGGVVSNVKLNQRIFELPGVDRIYVHPNMADGGCGTGAALLEFQGRADLSRPMADAFLGPDYTDDQMRAALTRSQLPFDHYAPIEPKIAQLIAAGKVVARFTGRMEYGPRSLGNRSILYHAREPEVNQWLNQRLGRTEFMPFAPATLHERRHQCYRNVDGADFAAEFMTITFDCTPFMREESPAAVHVDGTARPQLVTERSNPSLHAVLSEYHRLTGLPTIINTSFNMHEEPIVCTPDDAVSAFLQGNLDYLAIGPFLVAHPSR